MKVIVVHRPAKQSARKNRGVYAAPALEGNCLKHDILKGFVILLEMLTSPLASIESALCSY